MAAPRYIRGDTAPVFPKVATATPLAIGDLLAQVTGNLIPAASFTWTTDLPTTQTAFALAFMGVSAQRKDAAMVRIPGNSTDNTVRSSSGIWEYDCASATFNVGDLVGPAKDTGLNLLSASVVAVASLALAIGRVAEPVIVAGTRVRVEILSSLHPTSRV